MAATHSNITAEFVLKDKSESNSHHESQNCCLQMDTHIQTLLNDVKSLHKIVNILSGDNVFENDDINLMYNFFLNTYLRIFYSCFPLKKLITMTNGNVWITMGIRTSCKHKRDL